MRMRVSHSQMLLNELTAGGTNDGEDDREDGYDAEHLADIAINLVSSRQARRTDDGNVVCAELCLLPPPPPGTVTFARQTGS